MENIGRVYTRNGKFNEAIEIYEKKLPYLTDNDLENAWLYHEIGRCYLEISSLLLFSSLNNNKKKRVLNLF